MRSRLWAVYLLVAALVATGYTFLDSPRAIDVVWSAVVWSSVVAIGVGLRLHRPVPSRPWWLLLAGMTAFGVAGIVNPSSLGLGEDSLRAVTADLLYLAGYLAIGAVAIILVRAQTPAGDRDGIIDGVIVMVALATVLWSVVIDPAALGATASPTERLMYMVAPLVPAGVAAACIRLLLAAGGRARSAVLLAVAGILAFVGSTSWILLLQAGTYESGTWSDVLWLASIASAGASALHPSMVMLTRRTAAVGDTISSGRLAVLGVALLATPAALLQAAGFANVHVAAPVVGAAVIALLVLWRLARLVRERERARGELEIRSARQAVVSRLGESALTDQPLDALYAEAEALADQVIEGAVLAFRPGRTDHAAPGAGVPARLISLPIVGRHGAVGVLEVVAQPPRVFSDEERAFLATVVALLSGATRRRQAEEDLRTRALHDDLTGLPNRTLVLDRLAQALAQRADRPVAVLFVDLDGFKPVNDTHGHEAGDAVLRHVARAMERALRDGDTLGRFAGDEFVVAAPDCDPAALAGLAGRLLTAVATPVRVGTHTLSVKASVGAVVAQPDERTPDEVIRRADAAMYEAKAAGGGTVAFGAKSATADRPQRDSGEVTVSRG